MSYSFPNNFSSGDFYFNFYYPAAIYNEVDYCSYGDNDNQKNQYGKEKEYVCFSGSEGGSLEYRLSELENFSTYDKILENILFTEINQLQDGYVIDSKVEDSDDYGRVVVTGFRPGTEDVAYIVVTVTDYCVYEMRLYTPAYTDDMDMLYKQYVTECCYRMCGFCFAPDEARPFDEFFEQYH